MYHHHHLFQSLWNVESTLLVEVNVGKDVDLSMGLSGTDEANSQGNL